MGLDPFRVGRPLQSGCFNPRARMGRDARHQGNHHQIKSFNPRARMGRDEMNKLTSGGASKFQPTRPHGARQNHVRSHRRPNRVSTHAPAWGATIRHVDVNPCRQVSTHAPAWGATCRDEYSISLDVRFNPRARMGRDSSGSAVMRTTVRFNPRARMGRDHGMTWHCRLWRVSTHAPAWGATAPFFCANAQNAVSTHAPAWGATLNSRNWRLA